MNLRALVIFLVSRNCDLSILALGLYGWVSLFCVLVSAVSILWYWFRSRLFFLFSDICFPVSQFWFGFFFSFVFTTPSLLYFAFLRSCNSLWLIDFSFVQLSLFHQPGSEVFATDCCYKHWDSLFGSEIGKRAIFSFSSWFLLYIFPFFMHFFFFFVFQSVAFVVTSLISILRCMLFFFHVLFQSFQPLSIIVMFSQIRFYRVGRVLGFHL